MVPSRSASFQFFGYFEIIANVFSKYFQNLKRPQTRSGSGSVGLSITKLVFVKLFFLGDFRVLGQSFLVMKNTPEIKKLSNAITGALPVDHINAMVRALQSHGGFTIDRDHNAGTISAYHTASLREVFSAIETSGKAWIYRHHKNLFA